VCKGGEYPLPLYVLRFMIENVYVKYDKAACKCRREVNTLRARLLLYISAKAN
jgi:hypothetical protein